MADVVEVYTPVTVLGPAVTSVTVIEVIQAGARGPTGPAGGTPNVFTQDVAATTWTIPHGFTYRPVVAVTDSAGNEVDVEIDNTTVGTTYVRSYYPFAGKAIYV